MSRTLCNLDLNLLCALDALLRERNVTRAGASLCVSQPAMSASLSKLRRHFNDQLLERQGLQYVLTPLGASLRDLVEETLRLAQRTFDTQRNFESERSDREFHIVASDYAQAVLGPALATLAAHRAPHVRLRFENVGVHTIDDVELRLRTIDALFVPTGFVEGYPHFELYRDTWVCVAWDGNTDISEDTLRTCSRIAAYDSDRTFTYADRHLDILGFDRSSVVTDGFLATPFLLTGTNAVALLPKRLAELTKEAAALRILPTNFNLPPLIESVWWHDINNADPGHRWLRGLIRDAAKSIVPAPACR